MKITSIGFGKLAFIGSLICVTGCRPTLELTTEFTTAVPGEAIEVEWGVEFAKGTTSSKVTLSHGLGEVESEGAAEVYLDETDDIELKVNAFVLGMPMSSKKTITINVLEDNFKAWDFEDLKGDEGWQREYALYKSNDVSYDHNSIDADPARKSACVMSSDADPQSPVLDSLWDDQKSINDDKSISLCLENPNWDDDLKYPMLGFIKKKLSESEDFEFEKDTEYPVNFYITYAIKFDKDVCDEDNIDSSIFDNFKLFVAASNEEIQVDEVDGDYRLKIEEITGDDKDDYLPYEVISLGSQFSNHNNLRLIDDFLNSENLNPDADEKPNTDAAKEEECKLNYVHVTTFDGLGDNPLKVTPDGNEEIWVAAGFLSTLEDNEVEVYIDKIKVSAYIEE